MRRAAKVPGRSKYGAVRTEVDGHVFASKKEARRYQELRLLERAGEIHGLTCQFKMRLCAWRKDADMADIEKWPVLIGHYVADFTYCTHDVGKSIHHASGTCVVEDTKGFRTPLYRWKKKHVEAQYGITITEI